jgi:hypothetical protein
MYKHTQFGYEMLILSSFIWLFLFYKNDSILSLGLFILCILMFSTLTVRVYNGQLEWYFGPYIWKKQISLKEIKQVSIEPIRWYYGYGVRTSRNKTLYTVTGSKAVRLDLHNGESILLGGNNTDELLNILQNEISKIAKD